MRAERYDYGKKKGNSFTRGAKIAWGFIGKEWKFLILAALLIGGRVEHRKQAELTMASCTIGFMVLDSISERNYLDSIYYDHLRECSWIDRNSVAVGHGGVLYSAYHKNPLKR